jgi:hypothetical protein
MDNEVISDAVEEIVKSIKANNNPKSFILKPFFRFYIEAKLEAASYRKEECTPLVLNRLSRVITQKVDPVFKEGGKKFKRANKLYIFGVELGSKLQHLHDEFKPTFKSKKKSGNQHSREEEEESDRDELS